MMRLLLFEDEARIARFIARGLRERAYAVDLAANDEGTLYQFALNTYDARHPRRDDSAPP